MTLLLRESKRRCEVVSKQRWQVGDPPVSRDAHADNTPPEQPALHLGEPCPYVVVPPDQPGPSFHGVRTLGRCGQDARSAERLSECAGILSRELDISVDVQPWESPGCAIARCQGLSL